MNVRKPTDYSTLFAALDALMTANLPQMKLYCEVGRLVSHRPEKGAAVAAAEHLQSTYPDTAGFSPRNLRRMRDFYRTYESVPEAMAAAMTIGWTQNIIILEAELTVYEKLWYIHAVQQFGWSKLKLGEQIVASAHWGIVLDLTEEACYTEENSASERVNDYKNSPYFPRQHQSQPDGRVSNGRSGEKSQIGNPIPHRVRSHQHRGDWQSGLPSSKTQTGGAWHRLHWKNGAAAHQQRLRQVRPPDWDGPSQPAEYALHLWRRLRGQDAPVDGLHQPFWRCGRSMYMDDFETTWRDVLAGCHALLEHLSAERKNVD